MILSFHPCYEGDKNIICAGRRPDEHDRAAMAQADAVILPQGCTRLLYEAARHHCLHVFPDYGFDIRNRLNIKALHLKA